MKRILDVVRNARVRIFRQRAFDGDVITKPPRFERVERDDFDKRAERATGGFFLVGGVFEYGVRKRPLQSVNGWITHAKDFTDDMAEGEKEILCFTPSRKSRFLFRQTLWIFLGKISRPSLLYARQNIRHNLPLRLRALRAAVMETHAHFRKCAKVGIHNPKLKHFGSVIVILSIVNATTGSTSQNFQVINWLANAI